MNRQLPSASDYPEVLRDLQTFLTSELEDLGFGLDTGRFVLTVTELIRAHWGGTQIYIPRGKYVEITVRDIKVEASFTGNKTDTRKICRRYNLTERHVYRSVNHVREARRKGLRESSEANHDTETGGNNA